MLLKLQHFDHCSESVIEDKQNDIKNMKILQNGDNFKEISFQRKIETGDKNDVNLRDILEVFVFTQHERHLEFKSEEKDFDLVELNNQNQDIEPYTGRAISAI